MCFSELHACAWLESNQRLHVIVPLYPMYLPSAPPTDKSHIFLCLAGTTPGAQHAGEQSRQRHKLMFSLNYALARGRVCTCIVSAEVSVAIATGVIH
jgi:hypothetical protein